MLQRFIQTLGIVAVTGTALLLSPAIGTAQHHSSGGRGGPPSAASPSHGAHPSSASPYHGGHPSGASPYYGGRGYNDHRGYPYGAWGGYGYYPRSYDRYYYGSSIPDYTIAPDYYDEPFTGAAPEQAGSRVVANFRMPTADAQLFVEGQKMDGQGVTRQFVSPTLDADGSFTYHFEARWSQDGQERKQDKKVQVHPGDRITVDFARQ